METAFGTLLQRGDGATPTENFTTIAELSSVQAPISRSEIDGSHFQSPGAWMQFKPGMKSAEISFEGNWLPGNPTQNASTGMLADFNSGVIRNYRIVWRGEEVGVWEAPAFLREFEPGGSTDDKLAMSGTFRVAGEMDMEAED